MIVVRKSPCNCWDCRRSRGETPPVSEERASYDEQGRLKRNIPLYLGAPDGRSGQVLTDADIIGHDRPPKVRPLRDILRNLKQKKEGK